MFSLLRKKDNLSQSSKVSTSCPSINSPGGSVPDENEQPSPNPSNDMSQGSTASSDSDEEGIPKVSRSQRMFARKSVRRQRKKEKEFEKKIKHNKITMDDYLSKQAEFKLWLSEEKHKTVNDMKSPKTKAYFKAFVKLWNKKKLNQKFYRGTVSCETPPNPTGRQRCSFLSLADSPFPNSVSFPQTIDLSHEGSILSDSPFSTFGKSPGNPSGSKTPGSAHDLLDLKRKAIFNNINKENGESDRQSDQNSDDPFLPATTRKSGSSSQSSSESTSGSISDSPRSSKSSASRKEKEENLYKVTVLSWTSKGELKVRPQNSPDLPGNQLPSEIDPDVLSKHLTSQDYTSIDQQNTSIPYKEVNDAISDDFHDPTYCVVGFPAPGYAEPYSCQSKQDMSVNKDKPGNASSIEDLYAVPIKKKKSGDQSETISLTSNESATRLDRKVSNQVEMEKLSDIISSGSDFSITSGSSNESLNQNYLSVPDQDGLGKASSAPELSTILESEVTKMAEKSYDEAANFTNVTAINMTLNTSSLNGNTAQQNNDQKVVGNIKVVDNKDWKMKRFAEIGSLTTSTPDRKRNLSDPSKQIRAEMAGQSKESQTAQRTMSDPTASSPIKQYLKRVLTPRSSLPSPPPPPPNKDYPLCSPLLTPSVKDYPLCSPLPSKDYQLCSPLPQPPNKDYPLCSPPPSDTSDIKSPNSESWPTPPPLVEQVHVHASESKPTPDSWPTPPTPYDLCDTDKGLDINSQQPSPPIPPDPIMQTPDSVFSDTQKWPTPPTPQDFLPERLHSNSDEEPPILITADFKSETEPENIKPPILKISEITNVNDRDPPQTQDRHSSMVKKVPFQENQKNTLAETKVDGSNTKYSERQVSTTSIERFETDIDAVLDSPTCDKENTQTKTRMVLETVV